MSTLKMVVSVLLVVGVAGVVNAYGISDNFDSYANNTNLGSAGAPDWNGNHANMPIVQDGIGVGGSKGVTAAQYGAVMSGVEANKVVWSTFADGTQFKFSMDFMTNATGNFNDDRLYLSASADGVNNSANDFGVQLDFETSGGVAADPAITPANNKNHIETYYRTAAGVRVQVPFVYDILVDANAWYTLNLIITKTGDTSALFYASLSDLGGALIGGGTWDTESLPDNQPNASYFDELWPAFKNFSTGTSNTGSSQIASVGADNFSFAVVPEPMTLGLLGLGGLALLRKRRA